MRTRLVLLIAGAGALLMLLPAAATASSFRTGFADPLFASAEAATREQWLGTAGDTHASIVRIVVPWRNVAPPSPPADFDAADPTSPGYNWTTIDNAVRSAAINGLEVLFELNSAPAWAEGPARPAGVAAGSWEPQAADFGAFARAIATRYDGKFPDPMMPGASLPAVHYFEAWNEPNLSNYLTPQYEGTKQVSAAIYRALLNSFYAGIKAVQPEATVIAGSLAPFGDEPGGERTRPVLFLRELLCLRGGSLKPSKCPRPAHFDALSDHPIAVGPPSQSATSPLDVTTPNLGRLTKVLRKAEATKRALPAGHKPLWVTEFWYDSDPPDPTGVPLDQQARWYEQDLYLFWKQGAEVAVALQLRDAPEGKSYASTYQSGAYFLDGSPKPSATAFRFPFVTHRTGPFTVGVWGIAPRAGSVVIQAARAGGWKALGKVRAAGPGHPFSGEFKLFRFAKLRAVIGGKASLPWSQR